MRYFKGIDGGASKTHALILDETGRAVGFGHGGTGNHQIHGLDAAMREVEAAIRAALGAADLPASAVEMGYFCLAGADLPEDFTMLQESVERLALCSRVIIDNDTMAALRSGLSRSWGVVVICGTGTNGAGIGQDGREIRLPGLGEISGDWGGGSGIAQEALRLVMRAWDGRGEPTMLREMLLNLLGCPDEETVIAKLYHEEIAFRALLPIVPLVFEAALQSDRPAVDLIERVGTEVGVTASALIRRLDLQATDVEVVLGGSVFKGKGPLLIDTVRGVVHQVAPAARLVRPTHEPVVGAALLALEHAGITVSEDVSARLTTTLAQLAGYPQPQP
jgi:N-acetylglucosamine kinase-like BadF-type ATPase